MKIRNHFEKVHHGQTEVPLSVLIHYTANLGPPVLQMKMMKKNCNFLLICYQDFPNHHHSFLLVSLLLPFSENHILQLTKHALKVLENFPHKLPQFFQ